MAFSVSCVHRLHPLQPLCAFMLCAAVSSAQAELAANRLWVNAGFYSAHFDSDKGLRNANPGLGFEYTLNDSWSVTAGRFINSDNAHSSYMGAYYQPWRLGDVKLGVVGGAFNGYPKAFNGGWFPAVIPTATLERGHWGLNVALVPPLKDRLYGAVSFQLKYRFQPGL
jgi:hypothetical protein